jgi:hypothetical protein
MSSRHQDFQDLPCKGLDEKEYKGNLGHPFIQTFTGQVLV